MGFSLGKLLGKVGGILGKVGPVASLFNPALGVAFSSIGGAFGQPGGPDLRASGGGPNVFARPSFSPAALVAGGPTWQVEGGGGVTPVGGTTGGLMLRAAGRVAQIMAKIAAHLGRRIAKWRVIDFIKKWGPFAASAALGITADEALELWLAEGGQGRRRRARGVSGADIRRTTRVLGTLDRFSDRVRKFCGPSGFGRRRAPARAAAGRKRR